MSVHTQESIRLARRSDADAIACLLTELGYPTDADPVGARLERLLDRDDAGVLVHEVDATAVALAAYQLIALLERPQPLCRITALVVRADQRRQGVGADLIARVEALARSRGCFRLELTTQPHRADARAFYATRGFHQAPYRLVKPLG